ncbi:MAG: adenylate cyclase [Gemmatimonadota bacterium]|nr:MAG: adenylate cyclase [Gemmatimonadota bacterium]
MPRNVEIKATLDDVVATRARAARLADGPAQVLVQEDVFFRVPRGRLKLRSFPEGPAELIFYDRPDHEGPKTSDYRIEPVADPVRLRAVLELACGVRAVVRKRRELFLSGRTRIHLDQVEGLGDFLELEVVLGGGESTEDGEREARECLAALDVDAAHLVAGAYVDLLEARTGGTP